MRFCLAATVLAVAVSGSTAYAIPITGGPAGLFNPDSIITFDELGNLQGQVITNQFAAFGATFSGVGWDNATQGQAGSTGFAGGDLVNGTPGYPSGPVVISFNQLMRGAAFAAVDQNGFFTVESFLGGVGGTLVESFGLAIPFNPGIGFIGFQNSSSFDTIRISTTGAAALTIDTLQMDVPEPVTIALLGGGLLALSLFRRRS